MSDEKKHVDAATASMSNKSEENFRFLGRTFDIQKAIEMVARGDVVDQGEIAIKDIWKWINVIEIDKDYASQITADRLETPVIVAKLANEDLLIDGYHRLAKAIAVGRKTLPFVSIDGDDVLLESESLFKAKPPKHLLSRMRGMNRKEAAQRFIELHKPNRIDVDYINSGYGSVEKYLDVEGSWLGDGGERYVEISKFDSIDGTTKTVEWFEEMFEVGHYQLPANKRLTPEDWTIQLDIESNFDLAIDHAIKLSKTHHDVTITRWEGGEPVEDIKLEDYLDE